MSVIKNFEAFVSCLNCSIDVINAFFEKFFFFKIYGFPFLLLLVLIAFILSNFVFKFVSIRLLLHTWDIIRDKFTAPNDPGTISHTQAVYTEALSTLGLGSVAGVAIAIAMAGPGAILWLIVAGLLGMSTKFAEVTLGHKYRVFNKSGTINGGPFLYIKKGLSEIGYPKIGIVIGTIYAFTMILASVGTSTIFQTNQTVMMLAEDMHVKSFPLLPIIMVVTPVVVIVLFKLDKIAKIADTVIPFMTIFYVLASILVLLMHYKNILPSFALIWHDAFNPASIQGGITGSIVVGFARAMYATTSGSGTSAIAHAPSKTSEHVREGCAAFIDVLLALLMCLMTGMVVIVTGVYSKHGVDCERGIAIAKEAFSTVHPYFSKTLTIAVFLLALTTVIGWSYYGSMAWMYLFGEQTVFIYKIIFVLFTIYAAIAGNASGILKLCDHIWTIVMVPNLLTVFLLAKPIRHDIKSYIDRWKKGLFHVYK
ncbi:alanine or glycine:cation symporter, AGCS family [Candidatus Xenohaliotis californiensis]|uniref:Alanine or glycine:cation symporter, AGCS family n=1 Tax=Candidatus Xenohaliotis californiensis TaxID=84677 RepID=A0ABP0EXE7_9RICK|nr:alanine or glycine:cation symporter, AGCS family [Candidatus Xenohaliotis californiensis]